MRRRWRSTAATRRRSTQTRRSRRCRAAGGSASRWRASWPASPICCCSTSRPTTSTSRASSGWRGCWPRSPFATMTITHDRLFLQRMATRILELDRRNAGGLLSVAGDYAAYLRVKARARCTPRSGERSSCATPCVARPSGCGAARPRAPPSRRRASSAPATLAAEVAELEPPQPTAHRDAGLSVAGRQPKRLIEAKGVGQELRRPDDLPAASTCSSGPGARIGLLGPNGCGKSTLLRVLLGEEPPAEGTVLRADGLDGGLLRAGARRARSRRARWPTPSAPTATSCRYRGARVHVRGYLERFLFTSEQMDMAVGKLSGGEQSRLLLAALMLRRGADAGAGRADQRSGSGDAGRPRGVADRVRRRGAAGVARSVLPRPGGDDDAGVRLHRAARARSSRSPASAQWEGWRAEVWSRPRGGHGGQRDVRGGRRRARAAAASSATRSSASTTPSRRRWRRAEDGRCNEAVADERASRARSRRRASRRAPGAGRASAAPRSIASTRAGPSSRPNAPDLRYNPPHGNDHDRERTAVRRHQARHRRRARPARRA